MPEQEVEYKTNRSGKERVDVKTSRDGLLDMQNCSQELKQICEDNQKFSPLLRLPAEIRMRIYKLLLGGRTFRLEQHARYRYSLCYRDLTSNRYIAQPKKEIEKWVPGFVTDTRLITGTCRQLYEETVLLPYQLNEFHISGPTTLELWIASLVPAQLKSIEHLRLRRVDHWATMTKGKLKLLKNLRKMTIEIEFNDSSDFWRFKMGIRSFEDYCAWFLGRNVVVRICRELGIELETIEAPSSDRSNDTW